MKTPNTAKCVNLVLSLIGMAGIISPAYSYASDDTLRITPSMNTESTAQVGDEIIHQGAYYERDVIHLSHKITIGENDAYTLTPGYYFKTGEEGEWEYYTPATDDPNGGSVKKAPEVVTLQESFQVSSDGKTVGVVTNYYQAVRGKATGITRSTRSALSNESFQKALVYGGKVGNKIKLGYREIWMNIVRPSELQYIEHDLTKSKIVESNGARIEVLSATDNSIRYRITKSFSSEK
jgi:hypothetical protein